MLALALILIGLTSFNIYDCQQMQTINLYDNALYATLSNDGVNTQFRITTTLANGVATSNAWLAFGLNDKADMGGTDHVVCRYSQSESFVHHYYNPTFPIPQLIDSANPSFGLSSASVSMVGGNLTCSFTRLNQSPGKSNYYQISESSKPYIVSAYGSGGLSYHGRNRAISSNMLSFANSNSSNNGGNGNNNNNQNQNNFIEQILQLFQYLYSILFKKN